MKFCTKCGAELSGQKFCPQCGTSLENDTNSKENVNNRKTDISSFLFWFSWVVLAVTGIMSSYFLIHNLNNHLSLLEQYGVSILFSIGNIAISYEALIGMFLVYLLRNKKSKYTISALFCGLTAFIMLFFNVIHLILQNKELSGIISIILYDISGQYVDCLLLIIINIIAMIALLWSKRRQK